MASVEQRENHSTSLGTISDTLDLFDKFKVIDEEKDSDEESFHLPMLDCEDDTHSNKDIQNCETEDDILNKFESSGTPDVMDPKAEESILNEDDDLLNEKQDGRNEAVATENIPAQGITEDRPTPSDGNKLGESRIDQNNIEEEENVNPSCAQEMSKEGIATSDASNLEKDVTNSLAKDAQVTEIFEDIDDTPNDNQTDSVKHSIEEAIERLLSEDDSVMVEHSSADDHKDFDEKTEDGNIERNDFITAEVEKEHKMEEQEILTVDEPAKTLTEVEEIENHSTDMQMDEDSPSEPLETITDFAPADVNTERDVANSHATDSTQSLEVIDSDTVVTEINDVNDQTKDDKLDGVVTAISEDENLVQESDRPLREDEEKEPKVSIPANQPECYRDVAEKTSSSIIDDDSVDLSEKEKEINVEGCHDKKDDVLNENVENLLEDSNSDAIVLTKPNKLPCNDCITIDDDEVVSPDVVDSSCVTNDKTVEHNIDSGSSTDSSEVIKESDTNEGNNADTPKECNDSISVDDDAVSRDVEDSSITKNDKTSEHPVDTGSFSTDSSESNKENDANAENSADTSKENIQSTAAKTNSAECITSVESYKRIDKNDSDKDGSLECNDLLDISIIRDVDEDNAKAAADSVNDAQGSDQDDDKGENEVSECDQEENLLSSDKDDQMDFDDGNNSNLCDDESSFINSITSVKAITQDIDPINKVSEEITDSEMSMSYDDKSERGKTESNAPSYEAPEEPVEYLDLDQHMAQQRALSAAGSKSFGKRSGGEIAEVSNKKIKLSESSGDKNKKNYEIKTLISFEKFMQSKTFKNKLTKSDVEQFCLQKICEAIMHRSDVGELHQTIKKQEQFIENLRKDIQQLTKQTRDLDIVNKKLMNELKAQNGNKKPLVPLKITRSVGLQVKLNAVEQTTRRKQSSTPNRINSTPQPASTPNTPKRARNITPVNAGVVRQVAPVNSPRKLPTPTIQTTPNSTTPLLSQALQNTPRQVTPANVAKRTIVKAKTIEPPKPVTAPNPGVIDLTDDDTAARIPQGTPVKILNKSVGQQKTMNMQKQVNKINSQNKGAGTPAKPALSTKGTPTRTVTTLPQGVRLTPTQMKNGIAIPASVVTSASGAPQVMYVVQPQLVTSTANGTQKAVLLNFQPGNSILTSTLNPSAVSVIPTKTTNTVQIKTVSSLSRKHPAPLPSPPIFPTNALLKPVLPKPHLSIRKTDTGIILQWRMPYNLDLFEGIASYQLFAYQETNSLPSTDMWRKVGDVKALALPMACTLTQFADKNKYYFAVRSVDVHKRIGAFSDPEEISL